MYGVTERDGRSVNFGYSSFADWLDSVIESFPAPWSVGPLDGKYYGTEILDRNGKGLLNVWFSEGAPSDREKRGMTDDEWAEYCCDTHWESQIALNLAETIVRLRNRIAASEWGGDERLHGLLRVLLIEVGDWDTQQFDAVRQGGGPDKRVLGKSKNGFDIEYY